MIVKSASHPKYGSEKIDKNQSRSGRLGAQLSLKLTPTVAPKPGLRTSEPVSLRLRATVGDRKYRPPKTGARTNPDEPEMPDE
jgi:hypothetical protein